jgi:TalC/MipB family fructose-6-phosphate aldolase
MRLYLDSADPQEIRRFSRWRIVDGITTTPTFFRRLGVSDARAAVRRIAAEFDGEIHVEAMGRDADEIVAAARQNRELGASVVSKVPICPAGLEATRRLADEGVAVNLHLVFSVNQAVLAAKARAAYVCPLVGRMSDAGLDADEVVADIVRALSLHPALSTTTVMLSSIRSPEMARRALLTGAGAITLPGRVLSRMVESPLTDRAVSILAEDSVGASPVSSWMKGPEHLPVLQPAARLSDALVQMTHKGIGIAAVSADGSAVDGVITDGDLRRSLSETLDNRDVSVEAVMTRDPKHVGPHDRVEEAVELMRAHRIGQVLVLGPGRELLGFLNLHDLMIAPLA